METIKEMIILGGGILSILAVYSTSIPAYFVVSELSLIYLSIPETWEKVHQIFTERGLESLYYRPIQKLIYWMNYSLFGLNPTGHHVTSLFFHILNTILVFYLANILTKDRNASYIAALLFALHPLHTDAVNRIALVPDIAYTFFYMLAAISFIKYITLEETMGVYLAIAIFAFILSLLAKEAAITLPVVLFLYEFIFYLSKTHDYQLMSPHLNKYIPFLLILFIYFILRIFFIGSSMPARGIGLRTPLKVSYHFLQLFLPINIRAFNFRDRSKLIVNIIILFNFLFIVIFLAMGKKFEISKDIFIFCSLWVLITSFPLYFLALLPLSQVRALYISSVGSSILLGLLIMQGYYNLGEYNTGWAKIILIFLMFSLLSSWSVRAIQRNHIYKQVGDIAKNIILQFKNMYPEFPEGSNLYLINFPCYFLTDGETAVRAISDYRGALRFIYRDKSLNVYQDWDRLKEFEVRPISNYRSAQKPEQEKKLTKHDENLQFLKSNFFYENIEKKKGNFVFVYQNGLIVETTNLYTAVPLTHK